MSSHKRRSSKSSSRKVKRSRTVTKSRVKRVSKSRRKCNELLSKKIRQNIEEFKTGRYKSRQQAIAVSYSMINKKYPKCKTLFSRK